jgi:hypothetical protein
VTQDQIVEGTQAITYPDVPNITELDLPSRSKSPTFKHEMAKKMIDILCNAKQEPEVIPELLVGASTNEEVVEGNKEMATLKRKFEDNEAAII